MRFLVLSHYYAEHRGGIEIVAEKLALSLAQRGHQIAWAASDARGPSLRRVSPAPIREIRMRALDLFESRLGFPYPLWGPSALATLWREIGQAEVVHLHDYLYFGNICAFVLARVRGKRILVTQHIGEIPFKSPLLRNLLRVANATLGRLILAGADQVVFVGEGVRRHFEERIGFRTPPALIMNGLDATTFSPDSPDGARGSCRRALRRELGMSEDAPLFLFVGRFVEKKGLPLLRQLAEALPEVRWAFAGWGPLDPEAWHLPNVTVLKGLQGATLARAYRAADLLVLPSVGEGFPLVVQEAMACGTPALVGAETAEACPDSGDAILREEVSCPEAFQRWQQRLRSLASDREGLRALRPKVAEFALSRWSWETCADEYERRLSSPRPTFAQGS
ncbi:MAG: glycosyltransferase family 4 protein [Oligoflexia bacterium]|nr:glycosyltransferase family 4 protein [Oligoflexia bacterium]